MTKLSVAKILLAATAAALAFMSSGTEAHSLVFCTKYANGKCVGFPSGRAKYGSIHSHRIDDGSANTKAPCRQGGGASGYTTQFPMAKAAAGETVPISWYRNGHPKPSEEPVDIFAIPTPNKSGNDVSLADWMKSTKVAHFSYNGNCSATQQELPGFNGRDKTLCYNQYVIPKTWTAGTYSLMWTWRRSSKTTYYVGCFDVQVGGADASAPSTAPASSGAESPATTEKPTPAAKDSSSPADKPAKGATKPTKETTKEPAEESAKDTTAKGGAKDAESSGDDDESSE